MRSIAICRFDGPGNENSLGVVETERSQDHLALFVNGRLSDSLPRIGRKTEPAGIERRTVYFVAFAQNDGALDDVLQLADVARPFT